MYYTIYYLLYTIYTIYILYTILAEVLGRLPAGPNLGRRSMASYKLSLPKPILSLGDLRGNLYGIFSFRNSTPQQQDSALVTPSEIQELGSQIGHR